VLCSARRQTLDRDLLARGLNGLLDRHLLHTPVRHLAGEQLVRVAAVDRCATKAAGSYSNHDRFIEAMMLNGSYRILAPALLLAGACSRPEPRCVPDPGGGVVVSVVDATSDVAAATAVLIVRSDAFVDSIGPVAAVTNLEPPALRLTSTRARAGKYDVTVRSPGYQDWTQTGLVLPSDSCGAPPTEITARVTR
jgi:hypothetical protein